MLKALKALPGLKQSGRAWNRKLGKFLGSLGLVNLPGDQSIWVDQSRRAIVALYVDDMVIAAPTRAEVDHIKGALTAEYDM